MDKFLIINWGLIGDVISSTPLFEEIKSSFKDTHLTVITKPYSYPILQYNPYIDKIHILPKKEYIYEKILNRFSLFTFYKELLFCKYDYCIDLIGNTRSAFLSLLSKAKLKIGLYKKKHLRNIIYDKFVFLHNLSPHLSSKINEFLKTLNIKSRNLYPRIYLREEEIQRVKRLFSDVSDKRLKIGIFPGAGWHAKMWPLFYFRNIVDKFESPEIEFYLLLGPRESKEFVISCKGLFPDITLIENIDLRETVAFIKQLDLLITNDTGPLHISRAVNTPVIGLFGPTCPDVVELDKDSVGISGYYNCPYLDRKKGDINPCLNTFCKDPQCIKSITVAEVENALRIFISKMGG
ncbi:MAG: glycosyltransferase family 9 protein [Candidatus Hydrogenedentota bacterium]